jgi:hypothetical protein
MSPAAMKTRLETVTPEFVARMRRERYRSWRANVEQFAVAVGLRPLLAHLDDEVWEEYFTANEDAIGAVVEELQRID